jgi:hypothetical protein
MKIALAAALLAQSLLLGMFVGQVNYLKDSIQRDYVEFEERVNNELQVFRGALDSQAAWLRTLETAPTASLDPIYPIDLPAWEEDYYSPVFEPVVPSVKAPEPPKEPICRDFVFDECIKWE